MEGIAKAKAQGVYKGRKRAIDPAIVRELHEQGLGPTAIAKQLGIGRASVYRALRFAALQHRSLENLHRLVVQYIPTWSSARPFLDPPRIRPILRRSHFLGGSPRS
jgi:hypothetical protein